MEIGLRATESVLRGGFLKGPVILSDLEEADGTRFVRLRKGDRLWSDFLCRDACWKRSLKNALVIETLEKARNRAVEKALQAHRAKEAAEAEDDKLAALGVNEASGPNSSGKKKRLRRGWPASMERSAVVRVDMCGLEPWDVRVLLSKGFQAVSIEATAYNFGRLFELIQAAWRQGDSQRVRWGAGAEKDTSPPAAASRPHPWSAARGPKGADGQRKYWSAQRSRWHWLCKIRVAAESPAGTPQKKHKVLVRRSTEEGGGPGGRTARKPKSVARKARRGLLHDAVAGAVSDPAVPVGDAPGARLSPLPGAQGDAEDE